MEEVVLAERDAKLAGTRLQIEGQGEEGCIRFFDLRRLAFTEGDEGIGACKRIDGRLKPDLRFTQAEAVGFVELVVVGAEKCEVAVEADVRIENRRALAEAR